jgi:hypothetical protein
MIAQHQSIQGNAFPQTILGVMWIYLTRKEDWNLTISISIGVEMVFL